MKKKLILSEKFCNPHLVSRVASMFHLRWITGCRLVKWAWCVLLSSPLHPQSHSYSERTFRDWTWESSTNQVSLLHHNLVNLFCIPKSVTIQGENWGWFLLSYVHVLRFQTWLDTEIFFVKCWTCNKLNTVVKESWNSMVTVPHCYPFHGLAQFGRIHTVKSFFFYQNFLKEIHTLLNLEDMFWILHIYHQFQDVYKGARILQY